MQPTTFDQLDLIEPIRKALQEEGYTTPTPIQAQSIPQLLEGRDLLGCAQTGTGKTAAFAIPLIQRMVQAGPHQGGKRPIRALVLTPTRELAIQIEESFKAYGRHTALRSAVIFGGVGQKPQTDALRAGIDILIATPGRLLDLMGQGHVHLKELQYFVLDEADRMLDMGFVHDVKRVIAALPAKRHSLFFSATMPPEIQKLADTILTDPAKVEVTPVSSTAETVQQQVYFVDRGDKAALLTHLIKTLDIQQVLVFTRTKHGADKLVKILVKSGISAEAIHGNKAQNARQRALNNFKDHKTRVLVATDIAARGIDIDQLGHVVNHDIPDVAETYVHRIGRTGRAGASGLAISLCEPDEVINLRDVQRLIKRVVPVVEEHPFTLPEGTPIVDQARGQVVRGGQRRGGQQQQSRGDRQPRGDRGQGRADRPAREPRRERSPRPERAEGGASSSEGTEATATGDVPARKRNRNRNRGRGRDRERREGEAANTNGTGEGAVATNNGPRAERSENGERAERRERGPRSERGERRENDQRGPRPERGERRERGPRPERNEGEGQRERTPRPERSENRAPQEAKAPKRSAGVDYGRLTDELMADVDRAARGEKKAVKPEEKKAKKPWWKF